MYHDFIYCDYVIPATCLHVCEKLNIRQWFIIEKECIRKSMNHDAGDKIFVILRACDNTA